MALLRFLIVAIAILYIVRFLVRMLLPIFFQSLVEKASKDYYNQQKQEQKHKDGKTRVTYIPKQEQENPIEKHKKKALDSGEFVDYEEVK